MGWNWAKVSVVAIALAALGGCCPEQDDKLGCSLSPSGVEGVKVTVKGTAQYMTAVAGDAVIDDFTYYDGEGTEYVQLPKQPFSVTVELEVGDLFGSSIWGYVSDGSITARDTFTPADGSAIMDNQPRCATRDPG